MKNDDKSQYRCYYSGTQMSGSSNFHFKHMNGIIIVILVIIEHSCMPRCFIQLACAWTQDVLTSVCACMFTGHLPTRRAVCVCVCVWARTCVCVCVCATTSMWCLCVIKTHTVGWEGGVVSAASLSVCLSLSLPRSHAGARAHTHRLRWDAWAGTRPGARVPGL